MTDTLLNTYLDLEVPESKDYALLSLSQTSDKGTATAHVRLTAEGLDELVHAAREAKRELQG